MPSEGGSAPVEGSVNFTNQQGQAGLPAELLDIVLSRRRSTYVWLPLDYAGSEDASGKRTRRPWGIIIKNTERPLETENTCPMSQ